jgi:Ca2+-binding EF-hand superfamily protein
VELERLAGEQQSTEELMLEALKTIIDESFPSSEYVATDNADRIIANDNVILAAMLAQITADSNTLFGKMDVDSDKMLTKMEFINGLAGKASDTTLLAFWNALDVNHDMLLSATELIPFQIATNLSSYFNAIDQNTDGLLTFSELQTAFAGKATDAQLQMLINAVDTNGDGMISQQEATKFKLNDIDSKANSQLQELYALGSINQNIATIEASAVLDGTRHSQITGLLTSIDSWLYNIYQYTYKDYLNTKSLYTHFTGLSGYATGGIADGPLSGYAATLHGREAVIPLGDGNTVSAILQEPINRIGREAPDTAELRQALAELHAELKELRRENQQIGASQIGELKEHNRRERKREVVPQQVEVVTP